MAYYQPMPEEGDGELADWAWPVTGTVPTPGMLLVFGVTADVAAVPADGVLAELGSIQSPRPWSLMPRRRPR